MNFRQLGFSFFLIIPFTLFAQSTSLYNSSEIKLALKKLNTLGSALYIAAHPDDENTRLLAYLAKEKKFRTGYLSITRGDGGQNLIGNEQSELLGLIRTQELLAARRMDGAEQFFTRAIDFGFSKNSEETFSIWNKEQVLADAVWVIRKFRPDILITRFPEDARAGHGQHSASAIIAHEAFLAAADPKRFPEQLKYLKPWQAKRIVWNTFNFGGNNTTSPEQLKLDVGVYNPLLGKGYGEIAAESRTNHKSQGFGSARQRGQSLEYFTPVAGDIAKNDLFEGINTGWGRIEGGDVINKLIADADQSFDIEKPAKSVNSLVNILTAIEKIKDDYWRDQKSAELKDLIAAAAGLWLESYTPQAVYAVGDTIRIRSQVLVQSEADINLLQINDRMENTRLAQGVIKNVEINALANAITDPYWLTENHPHGMYLVKDLQLTGKPENSSYIVKFTFKINNKEISFLRPVMYKYTDQVRGEIYDPLVIAPPVTAGISDKAYIFSGNAAKTIQVQLKSYRDNSSGALIPLIPVGWKSDPRKIEFDLPRKGDEKMVEFIITPSDKALSGIFSLQINTNGSTYDRASKVISYEHIPQQTLFPRAETRIEKVDLKTGGKRIGYLAGAGDLIPESLQQIGYQVTSLSESEILNGNIAQYDAIITGVRAYNVNERIGQIQPGLMEYVKNGGTLVVQYNVSNPLLIQNVGPYPFKISRDRVTDENAKVTLLTKDHPVLNYPNKITEKDFDGWIQERGLYFTTDAHPQYSRILSMNDEGETAKDGALLVADYGKGRFVYTSLAFFRELPAGIPGAYRLFVNLITKNKD